MSAFLIDDMFDVLYINKDGKKFDKVSRVEAQSNAYTMNLQIDINVDVYPIAQDDRFSFAITKTLRKDGKQDSGYFDQEKYPSHADDFEYVMYGKVFQCSQEQEKTASVYVSFGGLLMCLSGEPAQLECLNLDDRIYVLIRKIPN